MFLQLVGFVSEFIDKLVVVGGFNRYGVAVEVNCTVGMESVTLFVGVEDNMLDGVDVVQPIKLISNKKQKKYVLCAIDLTLIF